VADGRERDLGGDPTDPDDGAEFRDSDQDGLSDTEESVLGWVINTSGVSRLVLSNPSRPDSDFDGLPDFAERVLNTDPNNADTDGDGLRDFDEMSAQQFEQFLGLDTQFPNFSLDGTSSKQYGTDPRQSDTDGDTLDDYQELLEGYRLLVPGETVFRQIFTNPLTIDTDKDGINDRDESNRRDSSGNFSPTDATDTDTDDDGRRDGLEALAGTDPLVKDVGVVVKLDRIRVDKIVDTSGDASPELLWFITVQKSGFNPSLLSSAADAFAGLQTPMFASFLNGGTTSCSMISGLAFGSNPYTFVLNKTQSYILQEGESITVRGIVAEGDSTSLNCGLAPDYIPTYVISGCATSFSEEFSYEDFKDGGQASFPFPDGTGTTENCDWTVEMGIKGQ